MPVADELRATRKGVADVAEAMGFKALAKGVRAGGPVEPVLRILINDARRKGVFFNVETRQRIINAETRAIQAKGEALARGLEAVRNRLLSLGGG